MNTNNQNKPDAIATPKVSWFSKLFLKGRIYLINPKFQWRFMGYVILTVVFSVSIIFLSNYFFFESFLAKGQALGLPEDHAFFVLIKEQRSLMTKIFFSVSSVISFIIGLWGMFFSHRIAGPLFRLRRHFVDAEREGKKKLGPVNFRENDFFQDIPEALNSYLASANLLEEDTQDSPPDIPVPQDENAA
ncbi:MAG: hypothetical protein ACPGJV_12915 [Bacteriovoracaceae bacterium]